MKLAPVSFNMIPLGRPLPYSLRNSDGILLAQRGYVFGEREALETLAAHGTLFVDPEEVRQYRRQLNAMVSNENTTIGQIADSQIMTTEAASTSLNRMSDDAVDDDAPVDWLDLQSQANALVRDPKSLRFMFRLDRLQRSMERMLKRSPDTVLFALIHLTASESRFYSATHAMLVCAMCSLAARDVLNWSSEMETAMVRACLTMNIGMTDLQDQLTQQREPPSAQQRLQIEHHHELSVDLLRKRGITDELWLEAILHHHSADSGPLAGRSAARQIARLIQRADGFAARLSPRATRPPLAPSVAMHATYFDESKKVDEAGASLIKAVGIYPPGSFVKLANNEVATVVRRGANTLTPRVAVLVNRNGMPMMEPAIRDTRIADYRITSSISFKDIRVRPDLVRLLALT
jgi:HD-GYP domain-containing protein (c-di-GMP phosphodiesterase class II)